MVKKILVVILAVVLLVGTVAGYVLIGPHGILEDEPFEPLLIFKSDCEYNLKVGESVKLEYEYDAEDAEVKFTSHDESVVTVSEDGTATAVSPGMAAANILVKSASRDTRFVYTVLINVTADNEASGDVIYGHSYFDASYETTSYVECGGVIKLNCSYIDENGKRLSDISFRSSNNYVSTVDENGYVKGITPGYTTVRATCKSNGKKFDFGITVLEKNLSAGMQSVIKNHNSNASVTYNLGIGDGVPSYYYDVVGSVNNMFFDPLKTDHRYYDKLALGEKNNGLMQKVEYITVHYTGNMNDTADADNNADYFNNLGYSASIHFVTGRSNVDNGYWSKDRYMAFAVLNEKYMGWHAGSHGLTDDTFRWLETGVPCTDKSKAPVICINRDGKFTVNGFATDIKVPDPRVAFTEVLGPTYLVRGTKVPTFNTQGIAWKVENGKYFIGNTYWNTQYKYTLSNVGGNNCSIGIESCVDRGSDLVHTWHVTAQLVASLIKKYDLDLSRVQGHHFFSGKDCPQPLLENNMDLWNNMFMPFVSAEYDRITRFRNYTFDYTTCKGADVLDAFGLLTQTGDTRLVTYTVDVKNGSRTETIKLSTIVESNQKRPPYEPGCESIQQLGMEIV